MKTPTRPPRRRMKRPSYRAAIAWIALNDEPAENHPEHVAQLISTAIVADLFDVAEEIVAAEVLRRRKREGII
jgi:hypothetical protein